MGIKLKEKPTLDARFKIEGTENTTLMRLGNQS
jgi:hypothetical protein